jgi:hypothetical protein
MTEIVTARRIFLRRNPWARRSLGVGVGLATAFLASPAFPQSVTVDLGGGGTATSQILQILAYVYRANGRLSAILQQGTQRP